MPSYSDKTMIHQAIFQSSEYNIFANAYIFANASKRKTRLKNFTWADTQNF